MKRGRHLLLLPLLLCCLIAGWLWWARPKNVDMAAYAPADSLLYLEANRPSEVFDAVATTEAWKTVTNALGVPAPEARTHWLQEFIRWTGLGPIRTVILARAQVAVVVTELKIAEEADTLNIKPQGALLIQTHTSQRRIRPIVEEALKTLAEKTYVRPTQRRLSIDGVEFIEWVAPGGSRQIVSAIFGSLVIIGTSEQVVQQCLAVAQGRATALNRDPELQAMRVRLEANRTLTFGYVPPGNSAKLLAVSLPILLGRAPGDSEFQRLITNGATKVFSSVGWSSGRFMTGIEDRYLINLQPGILDRLKPTFGSGNVNSPLRFAPPNVYSVTTYKFANPAAAWQTLKTAVSSQVDALSTILFSSLLKSALLSYGIDEPETFLGAVDGELMTMRLDENSERSILVGRIRDRASLRKLFLRTMTPRSGLEHGELLEDKQQEFAVSLGDELVVGGAASDVRRYLELPATGTPPNSPNLGRITFFGPSSRSANVVTYTDDSDRVRKFASTIVAAKGVGAIHLERMESAITLLPYSVTETTLGERGIERINRSPLGQFSSIVPLLFPEKSGVAQDEKPSR
jgi:hypothetical protein